MGRGDVLVGGVDRAEQIDFAGRLPQTVAVQAVAVEHRLHGLGETDVRPDSAGRPAVQVAEPTARRAAPVERSGWRCAARGTRRNPLARPAANA